MPNILPGGVDAVIMAEQPKKTLGLETVEPALTPPPAEQEPAIQKNPIRPGTTRKRDIPQGLWTKCPECEEMIFDKELEENLKVCPHCTHHFPTTAHARITSLTERGSFEEFDIDMTSVDTLEFTGTAAYADKLVKHSEKTGLKDAVVTGIGRIGAHQAGLAVMDFNFHGGSMW